MTVLTMGTVLISSWGVSGIISLRYHYTHKVSHPFESFDFLYDKPWQRVGPYIMGNYSVNHQQFIPIFLFFALFPP